MTYSDAFNIRTTSVKFNDVANAIDGAITRSFGKTTTGTSTAYIASPSPAWTSYDESASIVIIPHTNNTVGSPSVTLNISGLGAKVIKRAQADLTAGILQTGIPILLFYDGVNFQLISTTAANSLLLDGSNTMAANLNLGGYSVINTASGSASTAAIYAGSDSNTGIFSPAADTWAVTTDGTERLRINSTGQILGQTLGTASAPAMCIGNDINTGIYSPSADTWAVSTGGTERIRIDNSGRFGINSTNPVAGLDVNVTGSTDSCAFARFSNGPTGAILSFTKSRGTSVGTYTILSNGDGIGEIYFNGANGSSTTTGAVISAKISGTPGATDRMPTALEFYTRPDSVSALLQRMIIGSNGNVGIGTSGPAARLHVQDSNGKVYLGNSIDALDSGQNNSGAIYFGNNPSATTVPTAGIEASWGASNTNPQISIGVTRDGNKTRAFFSYDNTIRLFTANSERLRINANTFVLGAPATDAPGSNNEAGFSVTVSGSARGFTEMSRDSGGVLRINRVTNDGTLVVLDQGGVNEGVISVSGTTVTYGSFAGSHWSQFSDGGKPEVLRGTVLESIDELCEWPNEEQTERLCKVKISDTVGSSKVYGVFMTWDEDWESTNDMFVVSLGAFVCRINASETVQVGDLLESNGDGTARVQADDVIRSSTLGKVTCTVKTHEHPDGSYCVPAVLYCG